MNDTEKVKLIGQIAEEVLEYTAVTKETFFEGALFAIASIVAFKTEEDQ